MEQIPTPQNVPTKDKYFGYSSVICDMDGDPDGNGYEMIFGGPRGEMYFGEVGYWSRLQGSRNIVCLCQSHPCANP